MYIEVDGTYEAMLEYAQFRLRLNNNSDRDPYDILSNSCLHFMKTVVEKSGAKTPVLIDPRPNSYIEEFRDMYRDLDFDLKNNKLSIE